MKPRRWTHCAMLRGRPRRRCWAFLWPCLLSALVAATDPAPFVQRGKELEARKKYADAVAEYTKAVNARPLDGNTRALRGWARHLQGDNQGALADLEYAASRYPEDGRLHLMCGMVYRDLGNLPIAAREFAEAARLDPKSGRAPAEQAAVLNKLHDYAGAVAAASDAIKRSPNSFSYFEVRAIALEKLGKLDEALADLDRAAALTSDEKARASVAAIRQRVVAAQTIRSSSLGGSLVVSAEAREAAPTTRAASAVADFAPGRVALYEAPVAPQSQAGAPTRISVPVTSPSLPPPPANLVWKVSWGSLAPGWTVSNGNLARDRSNLLAGTGERELVDNPEFGALLNFRLGAEVLPGWQTRAVIEISPARERDYPTAEKVKTAAFTSKDGRPHPGLEGIKECQFQGLRAFRYDVYGRNSTLKEWGYFVELDPGRKLWAGVMCHINSAVLEPSRKVRDENGMPEKGWWLPKRLELEQTVDRLLAKNIRIEQGVSAVEVATLELQTEPAGKTELRADGRDGVTLKIRVKPGAAAAATGAQKATQGVTFMAEGQGAKWIDLSEPQMRDGWKVVYVQATNPESARSFAARPPATLQIRAQAQDGTRQLARLITLHVAAEAAIDAKPDRVEFLSKSGQSATIDLSVANPGTEPWEFRAEYAAGDRPVARIQIKRTGAARAGLELTEAGLQPLSDTASEIVTLRVFAEQKSAAPLERYVTVSIGQEGLYAVPIGKSADGLFHVVADGRKQTKVIDFRVMVWDPQTRRLVADGARAQQLTFAPDAGQPAESIHALEVAGLSTTDQIEKGGVRGVNDPSGIYRFTAVREVPANARLVTGRLRVTARVPSGKEFSTVLPLGLEPVTIGPESPDWKIEYERCQEVINRFVPAKYWPKLNDILERRKMALGPKGLFALRHQLWEIAVNLTLHEGDEGWAKLEPWESRMTAVLEWTEWGSKVAVDALANVALGPVYGAAASQMHEVIKSAVVAWNNGELPDNFSDWSWNQFVGRFNFAATMLSDPQVLVQRFEASKAEAFCICFGYQFAYNFLYQKQSFSDAAKNAAAFALNQALSGWLTMKIMQHPRFLATMKVDVPRDETVLWSGVGGKLMAGRKGTMLNTTEAGKWAQNTLSGPGLDWESEAKPIWAEISRRYAAAAKGKVSVYLERGLQPGKIFTETELGALLKNPDVTEINVFVREGREWVAQGLFKSK